MSFYYRLHITYPGKYIYYIDIDPQQALQLKLKVKLREDLYMEKVNINNLFYKKNYKSPLGDIILVSDEHKIIGLYVGKHKYLKTIISEDIIEGENIPILQEGIGWLDDYFAGKQPDLSRLCLDPKGGEFRQEVWKLLLEIPYGEITTYGEIGKKLAKRMGKEKMSAQAVGGAVGHNPISIIIPCHRVVGSSGSLTGFSGGINIKIKLLELEGVDMSKLFVPKKPL